MARWLIPLLLVLATLLCFWPALDNELVDFDDTADLVHNPDYKGLGWSNLRWMFSNTTMGHYRPLTWLSYGVDHVLWNGRPFGFHLTSLLLHAANGVLFWVLIRLLLRPLFPEQQRTLWFEICTAIGAAFFVLHPLRVESVAWASARKDVLSGFFLLLAVIGHLKGVERGKAWWVLAVVCYGLSLLSKAWGITLPVVLLLIDRYPLCRAWSRRLLWEKLPYVLLALPAALVAGRGMAPAMLDWQVFPLTRRLLTAAYGLCFYPFKTLWPTGLSPMYRLDLQAGPPAIDLVCVVIVLLLTAALWVLRRRWPAGLAAWVCFGLLVSPVLGLTQSGLQKVADRYSYLSCLPLGLLAAGGLCWLRGVWSRRVVCSLCVVALALLGGQTRRQCRVWHDTISLWTQAVTALDEDWAFVFRGLALAKRGQHEQALADFDHVIARNPRSAQAYSSRATTRMVAGNPLGALQDYDHSLRIEPDRPRVLVGRANARFRLGQFGAARRDLDRALELEPRLALGYMNRGILRRETRDLRGAERDLGRALKHRPRHARTLALRGEVRETMGDLKGGLRDYLALSSIAPDDWRNWVALARVYLRMGDRAGARVALAQARRCAPAEQLQRIERLIKRYR